MKKKAVKKKKKPVTKMGLKLGKQIDQMIATMGVKKKRTPVKKLKRRLSVRELERKIDKMVAEALSERD